jgi:hypothetical protein
MIIVHYADDIIVGFEYQTDARRFWDAMRERLEEYSLSLHPDKTRLIEFGRFAADQRARRGLGKPETFKFLGFTFICGRSRRGRFLLKRKSRGDRMRAKLKEIKEEMRRRRHQPVSEQGKWLRQVVAGFFEYHAVLRTRLRKNRMVAHAAIPSSWVSRARTTIRRTTWLSRRSSAAARRSSRARTLTGKRTPTVSLNSSRSLIRTSVVPAHQRRKSSTGSRALKIAHRHHACC